MTVENFEQDPNGAGQDAGTEVETQENAAPSAPAERTYTKAQYDAEFANARRSWEYQTEQRLAKERQAWQKAQAPQPQSDDPWSALDPNVAAAFRKIFDRELQKSIEPFKTAQETYQQQQEDLAFKSEEADLKAKYPDYAKNRAAVLEFAVANSIPNAEAAFHAWRSMTQWDKNASMAVTAHLAKKASQSARTPSTEGRGGGAPTSKQSFRDAKTGKLDYDAMDEAAKEMFRASEQS